MRKPRIRFTVRWMMFVVAIVGVIIWAERLRRLSIGYEITAAQQFEAGRHALDPIWLVQPAPVDSPTEKHRVDSQNRAEWHFQIAENYQRAARYPWLPVAPDPPEPK